ncbi:N-acetylmuramoyl-L-alanine amidase [Candidatus Poribacteria bacterium]|nr:N-acetylmuramoyl-L-alanine amidase [Candidatus Poribacteria bacterium]
MKTHNNYNSLLRQYPFLILIHLILIIFIKTHGYAQAQTVRFVNINGEVIAEAESVLHNKSVYLPVDIIKDVFDPEMTYNYHLPKKQLILKTKDKEIRLRMGSKTVNIVTDKKNVPINVPPQVIQGRPMLPMNFFQDILPIFDDIVVLYNPNLQRVRIIPKTAWEGNNDEAGKQFIVIIDPGHGGAEDNGCKGQNGLVEKDIVLAVAKKIQSLSKQEGFIIHLTREQDQYRSRIQRVQSTNKNQGQLFISLHCNASYSENQKGIRLYINNPNGQLRSKAGITKVIGQKGINILNQANYLKQSKDYATILQNELNFFTEDKITLKEFPMIALADVYMPAVLLELGFLSNTDDATKLANPDYISELAKSILRSIKLYETSINNSPDTANE